jgi:DNA-binding protein YbaB
VTSAFDEVMAEMMARLDKKREEVAQLYESQDEVTGTARSPRRQVSATVDARGEVVEVKFHGQSYKTMDPADLGKLIVTTIRDAREEARAQFYAVMAETDPEGAEFAQAASSVDWAEHLQRTMQLPPQLLSLLETPAENLLDSEEFSELMTILAGGSNAAAGKRVEGDDTAKRERGASGHDREE